MAAHPSRLARDLLRQRLQPIQQRGRFPQKPLAFLGERHAARLAHHERHPEPRLQPPHADSERRRRDVQQPGRRRQRARDAERPEHAQIVEIDHFDH